MCSEVKTSNGPSSEVTLFTHLCYPMTQDCAGGSADWCHKGDYGNRKRLGQCKSSGTSNDTSRLLHLKCCSRIMLRRMLCIILYASPYLFVMAAEILAEAIKSNTNI